MHSIAIHLAFLEPFKGILGDLALCLCQGTLEDIQVRPRLGGRGRWLVGDR